MAIVIMICVLLMLFGIADTKEWRTGTFVNGGNVTVCMDGLQINGTQGLQIHFYGFISKHHVSNVMIYKPMMNQAYQISVNRNYTGRIDKLKINNQQVCNELLSNPVKNQSDKISANKHYTGGIEWFKMNNSSLSFLLLNVTFMDSGTYKVSTMENSVVKGETSLLVARQTLFGQHGDSMNITFMCNKTNISSIKIEMMLFKIIFPVVIYDVSHANCTEFGDVFKNRIESCLFNGITFSLTIRSVTWLESGKYVAWDDMNFLLDSIFVEIEDTKTSSLETSKGYVTLPSAVNGPTDSSKFAKETASNELSSTDLPHGYFNSSFVTITASSDAENEVWFRLLFAAVGVAVTVPLIVASTLLILWRRGCFRFACMGPDCCQRSLIDITSDQALKMGPISKHTTNGAADDEREYEEPRSITTDLSIDSEPTDINSGQGLQMVPISKTTTKPAAADERDYEEPRSNTTDLSIYLEPFGIETAHTEDNNPGGSCSKEYEKLHPYGNQGNNMYSSLGAEHILENE